MKKILFVCTGNSCRSQMAEGFARHYANGRFEVRSAGIFPTGIHPMTIETMKEVAIDISGHCSTMLSASLMEWADYLVTLCGSARERKPRAPSHLTDLHWDIENPDILYTSEEDRRREFARIRDEIGRRVADLLSKIEKGEI
ncbi:MAG: arsenate reductase ArsC [Candidatus Zixiibacteriota bacterium]